MGKNFVKAYLEKENSFRDSPSCLISPGVDISVMVNSVGHFYFKWFEIIQSISILFIFILSIFIPNGL